MKTMKQENLGNQGKAILATVRYYGVVFKVLCTHDRLYLSLLLHPIRYFFWIKLKNPGYTTFEHQNYHRAALAFASDLFMAGCIRNAFPSVKISKITSLDHSIWFHTDCNCQDWHLFVNECDHCIGGRALNSSRYNIFT